MKLFTDNVTQGSSKSQRIGNKVFLRYVVIRGAFVNIITSNAGTNNSETGNMYYWVFKETKKDSLAEVKKRNDIVVDFSKSDS